MTQRPTEIAVGEPGWQGLLAGPRPLRAGRAGGPLTGIRVAIKDLFDVAGTVTGAGNPQWAAARDPALTDAAAVAGLAEAGAELFAKAATDEFAYSLDGTNVHFGTPLNTRAPARMPGGSSSGPAAAVAAGLVELGLGTDTAGSIRVPAGYCGLYGYRPTHGVISLQGAVALAPSFDTAGLLSQSVDVLHRAAVVLAGTATGQQPEPTGLVVPAFLADVPDAQSRSRFQDTLTLLGEELDVQRWVPTDGPFSSDLVVAYLALSRCEAWTTHGRWVQQNWTALGPDIAARFAAASRVTEASPEWIAGGQVRQRLLASLVEVLGTSRVLVLPAAANPALPLGASEQLRTASRDANIALCATAGLCGAPTVVVPVPDPRKLPFGLCLLATPGRDDLAFAAARLVRQVLSAP